MAITRSDIPVDPSVQHAPDLDRSPDAAAPPIPKPTVSHRLFYGLLAVLAVVTAYSNCLTNGFHFDDIPVIQSNLYLQKLGNIPRFFKAASTFTSTSGNAAYRPLTAASFAVDYAWGGGLNPAAFHATQLLLHLLTGAGVFLLARRMLQAWGSPYADDLALFGAALFGLHRVNTEAVNYLTARSEILAALGVTYSLVWFIHAGRWRKSFLWLLPMALGSLAKPSALIFPLVLFAYLALVPQPPAPQRDLATVLRTLRYFLPALLLAAGLFFFINAMGGPHLNYGHMPRMIFLQSQPRSWIYYLRLFVFPWPLSMDYGWLPVLHWRDAQVIGNAGALLLLGVAAVGYAWRRPFPGRLFLFGTVWFAASLLPSSSIFPLIELMREYRLYLPSAGLCICVIALAAELGAWLLPHRGGRSLLLLAGAALLGFQGVGTYQRNRVWRTDYTLWKSAVEASPENGRAWLGLAIAYLDAGQPGLARPCLERADSLGFRTHTLELNFARLEMIEGRKAEAELHFQRAIEIAPHEGDAHFGYALWLRENSRRDEAIVEMRTGLSLSPSSQFGRHTLMRLFDETGRLTEYCALARETLELGGDPALQTVYRRKCTTPGSAPAANPAAR